jgi:hypothetical protein
MPLDLLGFSLEVLKKMPLGKVYVVQFELRKLEVKKRSEAKITALLLVALMALQVKVGRNGDVSLTWYLHWCSTHKRNNRV